MLKGVCTVCGKATTQFVKTGSGLFNTLVNKLPFEFHLPGHNFTTQETFRIEKIIRKKGNKSLVKWLGYPANFNSWVDNKDLIKL